jgi:drug/metabolite transporter (DMT)-like permease
MSLVNVVCLLAFITVLSAGQLLFKISSGALVGRHLADGFIKLFLTPAFHSALLLYALSTLLWIWIISRVPLSLAYPFMALNVIAVPLLSQWLFSETLTMTYWIGAGLVLLGMTVIQLGA